MRCKTGKKEKSVKFDRFLRCITCIERYLGEKSPRRNRRVSVPLSPIFSLFLSPSGKLSQKLQQLLAEDEKAQVSPVIEKQRRPGPKDLADGIPSTAWPTVLKRVLENHEPLRKVAKEYGVSRETIRRLRQASQKKRAG
jgi:hypothetical protein